ncbi:unnamed protein product [Prorocentrum cordatum]|uniref:Uncharacterized protein n=1 Tax=Prorocentrum cordatum TaxID=2364126 RepID=A0ABN9RWH5_9DINO|nr:unnamed protein product [Polarella glacialis]
MLMGPILADFSEPRPAMATKGAGVTDWFDPATMASPQIPEDLVGIAHSMEQVDGEIDRLTTEEGYAAHRIPRKEPPHAHHTHTRSSAPRPWTGAGPPSLALAPLAAPPAPRTSDSWCPARAACFLPRASASSGTAPAGASPCTWRTGPAGTGASSGPWRARGASCRRAACASPPPPAPGGTALPAARPRPCS